ncbi:MAG: type II secretion system F family protein [Candidatus Thorarchaeota archaeon]|nr:type II secretion system F family protein [Candidatus Thorarchaeota archaeon]
MTLYERACHVAGKMPIFSRAGRHQHSHDLERATRFLAPLIRITPQEVVAGSYLYSILTLITVFGVGQFLGLSLLAVVPLAVINALFVYFAFSTYPVNRMNSYKLSLSEEADIIFEQFLLIFQSGGTIFDAIEMVAESDHPYLSQAFKEMIAKIMEGISPETLLSEFARNQPSDDLRRYITAVLSAMEQKTDLLEALSGESYEADMVLRSKNLELESRLLIVAALVTYTPIMFTLAASLAGFATNPLVMLLIPILVGLNAILRTRFSRAFAAYFDRPQNEGITRPTQKEILREYDEFLNLLMLVSERLRTGDTLEVALAQSRDDASPEVRPIVDRFLELIYEQQMSLQEAIEEAASLALGQRVAYLFRLMGRMCEASATDAGIRLGRIVTRLIKRTAVAKERESIIAAQRLKVYLLGLTSAIVLGLLSALAPFLFVASLFKGGGTTFGTISMWDLAPLLITLLALTISTGYQSTLMINGSRPRLMGLISGTLYWLSFVFAGSMMGLLS